MLLKSPKTPVNFSKKFQKGAMFDEKQQPISFAEFELDESRRILLRGGKPVTMNAKTFDVLTFLAANSGRVVTKNEILEAVWEGQFVEESNLSVQISTLRKVLGERKDAPRFLVTVPGKGYKFVAEVEKDEDEIIIEQHRLTLAQSVRLSDVVLITEVK